MLTLNHVGLKITKSHMNLVSTIDISDGVNQYKVDKLDI